MQHDMSINRTALRATLHCLTGCAIGEIAGLMLAAAFGWSNLMTLVVSISLAFVFGYTLSVWPLISANIPLKTALGVVLAADTLSIATMEVFDSLTVTVIPGAMEAGLSDLLFWASLVASLIAAFIAAFPVNRYLLQRGKGHALTHKYHNHGSEHEHHEHAHHHMH